MEAMRRGAITIRQSEMVALWVPQSLLAALDSAVAIEDTDRSKFIRRALRERLLSLNISVPEPAK